MTADDAATECPRPIGVWLELDLDAQPIEGTLSPSGGPPSPFVGWSGLPDAIAGRSEAHERPTTYADLTRPG